MVTEIETDTDTEDELVRLLELGAELLPLLEDDPAREVVFVNENDEKELVGLGGDIVPPAVVVSFPVAVIPEDVPEDEVADTGLVTDVLELPVTWEPVPLVEAFPGSAPLVTVTVPGSEDDAPAVTLGVRVVPFPLAAEVLPPVPVAAKLVTLDSVYGGTGVNCVTETDELVDGAVLVPEKVLCPVLLELLMLPLAELVVSSVDELVLLLETAKEEVRLSDTVPDPVTGPLPDIEVATVELLKVSVDDVRPALDDVFVYGGCVPTDTIVLVTGPVCTPDEGPDCGGYVIV